MRQARLYFHGVVAVEQVDHLDVPGPVAGRATRLVRDAQIDVGVVGQAFPLQRLEAAEVNRVDRCAGQIPAGTSLPRASSSDATRSPMAGV